MIFSVDLVAFSLLSGVVYIFVYVLALIITDSLHLLLLPHSYFDYNLCAIKDTKHTNKIKLEFV